MEEEKLKRLNILALESYTKKPKTVAEDSETAEDKINYEKALKSPVYVAVIPDKNVCHPELYDACLQVQGSHPSFLVLSERLLNVLPKTNDLSQPETLTLLFNGIYIGNPRDVRNYIIGMTKDLPPVKGLGRKIAKIDFLTYPLNMTLRL